MVQRQRQNAWCGDTGEETDGDYLRTTGLRATRMDTAGGSSNGGAGSRGGRVAKFLDSMEAAARINWLFRAGLSHALANTGKVEALGVRLDASWVVGGCQKV